MQLSEGARTTLDAICDTFVPGRDGLPSATDLHVPDVIVPTVTRFESPGYPVQPESVPLDGVPSAPPDRRTAVPSTAIAPDPVRVMVQSEAWPNSMLPTPSAVEVSPVMLPTGSAVQFWRSPLAGVPRAPPERRTAVPSTAIAPEPVRVIVVSEA